MKPQNNYLILKDFEDATADKTTESGIILPSLIENKDTCAWADIVAVNDNSKYKIGQRVIYSKYIPVQFYLDKIMYTAIKETDVICVL